MLKKILEYIKDEQLSIRVFKEKINIVNYKEILLFDDDHIIVDCNEMILSIYGSSLVINKLFEHELLIMGNINKIEFR